MGRIAEFDIAKGIGIMLVVIGTIVLVLASALYLPLFASYMGM